MLATVTSPLPGATWAPGSSQLIQWTPSLTNARVRIYTSDESGNPYSGPYVEVASGLSGTELNLSAPNAISSRARVEVVGFTSAGMGVTLRQQSVFRILPANALTTPTSLVMPTAGYAMTSLAVGTGAGPSLVALANDTFKPVVATWSGSSWTSQILRDSYTTPDGPAPATGLGLYGLTPSIHVDSAGNPSVAYFSLFAPVDTDLGALRYQSRQAGVWTVQTVDQVGEPDEGCSLVMDNENRPWIVYNSGSAGNYSLRISRRDAGLWTVVADDFAAFHPNDIRARFDQAGVLWITFRSAKTGKVYVITYENEYLSTRFASSVGCGPIALGTGTGGQPRIYYGQPGPTPNQAKLVTRQFVITNGGEYWLPAQDADAAVGTISGLDVLDSNLGPVAFYTQNGLLKSATPNGPDNWFTQVLVCAGLAVGPVNASATAAGTQWITYRDHLADELRAVQLGAGSGGDGEGEDPGEIVHAIALESANPVLHAGSLALALRMARVGRIDVELFDIAGRQVANRPTQTLEAGAHHLVWNPGRVEAGVYFVRVRANGSDVLKRRMVMLP